MEVAKFNVGGKRYEVSRSLLSEHPDTKLARRASETWQKDDPEAEIFEERSGLRFEFVLDYLRDGKVSLPVGVSKQALLDDLKYFGVEAVDESSIGESKHAALSLERMYQEIRTLDQQFKRFQEQADIAKAAKLCIEMFIQTYKGGSQVEISIPVAVGKKGQANPNHYATSVLVNNAAAMTQFNQYLSEVGLEATAAGNDWATLQLLRPSEKKKDNI